MTFLRRHLHAIGVALLALAASITSLGHDFTYDDRYVILTNDRVHSLRNLLALWQQSYWPPMFGSDGYRPIITSFFTLQWVAGGGAPWIYHLVNITLAVAVAVAVFWCASAILPRTAAWVAAALFAVHPVHVEVTGNVVGQSELVVALCLTLAMGLYLRRRLAGPLPGRDAALIVLLYTIGLFTKEHAIVLPALIVAAELTVLPPLGTWRSRFISLRPLALAFVAASLGYLLVRIHIQHDLAGFEPYPIFRFLKLGIFDRVATMMTEIPRVARLLVFPTHLSADYSPQDVIVANGFDPIQLPGLIITIGIVVLAVALRRRAPVSSFGLLWLIIAYLPVSNLLVPAGFITAERTLFFPSIGVVIVAGDVMRWLATRATRRDLRLAWGAVVLLLVLGLGRSIDRQRVWKNNDVFVAALMHDAPNGYRAHYIHGRHLGTNNRVREMEFEYRKAIRLFPYDAAMTLWIADGYTRVGMCRQANALFRWTYAVAPGLPGGRYEYVYCLAHEGRWQDARDQALTAVSLVDGPHIKLLHAAIAAADSALGRNRGRRL